MQKCGHCPREGAGVRSPLFPHSCHGIILQHPATKSWNLGEGLYRADVPGSDTHGLWNQREEENFKEM